MELLKVIYIIGVIITFVITVIGIMRALYIEHALKQIDKEHIDDTPIYVSFGKVSIFAFLLGLLSWIGLITSLLLISNIRYLVEERVRKILRTPITTL